jgi:hypothetical protein
MNASFKNKVARSKPCSDYINSDDSQEVVLLKRTIKLLRSQLESSYDIILSQERELNDYVKRQAVEVS